MRTETITKTYLKFDELTKEQQAKVVENFSNSFLYEACMHERIETLKAIATILDGKLDYALSCVPDRGEFITIKPVGFNVGLNFEALHDVIDEDCPFTGVCYDEDFKDKFLEYTDDKEEDHLKEALNHYIKCIHNEYESMLTVEYIGDLCEANDYEFDADTLEIV